MFRRGFGYQFLILIAILLVLPVVLALYMLHIINRTELALVENHKEKLTKAMNMLDEGFNKEYEKVFNKYLNADLPRREKVKLLNQELKPLIVRTGMNFPGVDIGFYSSKLDVILDGYAENYGENFSKRRKEAFEETVKKDKKVIELYGHSEGGLLETYRPLVRNNRIIGAIWATENISGIYRRVERVQTDAYLIIFLGVFLGLGGAFFLIGNFLRAVFTVQRGVQILENDLTYTLPPAEGELGHISKAVNHLATRLVNIQNYNEVILTSIDDGIVAVDMFERVMIVNPAANRILGLDQKCLEGKITSVFPPDSPFIDFLLKALTQKELVKDIELSWQKPGHGMLNLLVSTALLVSIRKEVIGVVLTCRDITEKRRLEEKVHLQERLASLGKLVAGVAHEVRNPLTSISGYLQFWQKNKSPSPEAVDTIYRQIKRLNSLVDKLLYFARPSQTRLIPCDLNQLLERVIHFFNQAHPSNIQIVTVFGQDLPQANVDPEQIEQVLTNIMYNAWQAMENGGKFRVETNFNSLRGCLKVSLTDSGCGIPKADLPHLFDPFFTTKAKGSGLGLAIAYEIIKAHGGSIEIESEAGKGTTVCLYLQPVSYRGEQDGLESACSR